MDQNHTATIPVNPLTLSFRNRSIEGDFRYYHSERLFSQSRIGLIAMAMLFIALGALEGLRDGGTLFAPIAYVVLGVLATVGLMLTFIEDIYSRRHLLTLLVVFVLGGGGLVLAGTVDSRALNTTAGAAAEASRVLILFWVWVLAGLRFPIALAAGSLLAAGQLLALWLFGSELTPMLRFTDTGVIVATSLFACFAAYQSEKGSRQLFFEYYKARETQQTRVTADAMSNDNGSGRDEGDWAKTLKDLSIELSSIHDMDLMFNRLLSFIGNIVPNDAAAVGFIKEKKMKPIVTTGALMGDQAEGIRNTLWDENLIKQLDFTKDGLVKETNTGVSGGMLVRKNKNFAYRLDIPVYSQKRLVGIMTMLRQEAKFNDYEVKIASSCIFHAMMALKNARMQQKLASQAAGQAQATNSGAPNVAPGPNTVPLSSAPLSHKLFREKAKPLFEKAIGADRMVSFLVLEIDQLTKLYENHGEKVARNVYALVARLLRNGIGGEDLLAYYGKTGFAVMLLDKDIMETQKLAQEVESKLRQQKLKVADGEIRVTLSMGISTYTEDAQDFMAILRAADMALFLVRETGGDGIRVNL
ncbi:MAG: GGDEF domain-containing protein [Pseudomonadota bacterium]